MKVREARFLKSASGQSSWPEVDLPEIAFAGRSNVGKSSLINSILGRRALARVSSTPGRTRTLNFIDVDLTIGGGVKTVRLCDLPGYGYAKVAKTERRSWGHMVEDYVQEREGLALVVLIVDARIEPTPLDGQMISWLQALGRPGLVVATKIDKIGKDKRRAVLEKITQSLETEVLPFSAVTGEGKDEVWTRLLRHALPPT